VGGGFHDAGLHSVLEPAAAGLPVVFGPGQGNTRAAGELVAAEGAAVAGGAGELAQVLLGWLQDQEQRHFSGARGRGYIDGHLGAAGQTADLLERLIDQHVDPGQ
jgi:3-deoxy-D-manno-octulosonic-acid transferase